MATLALPVSPLGERRQPAMVRSFALAALIHIALIGVMFLGVRWQIHPPDVISVELWEAQPVPPPPRVEPKVEPKPPPPPPKPEPEPEVKKPDIAEKAPPKPKPEPKKAEPPKPKPEPKKVEAKPRPDPREQQRIREQLASEERALDREKSERELKDLLERQAASAKNKALAEYIARITAKVRSNWLLPVDLKGNPEAVFSVVQLPTGEVLSARIVKSSGIPAYDAAVERAILKSSPLPQPPSRELFARELTLTFRPYDK